ncbi:MAG TPA: flagellin [Fimbriimonadaceae bacterium]|nr:flagellin [Fimbriimonadaceae bacterium]
MISINTNIAAMGAVYNLQNSDMALTNSIQRLSTGLRINTAADDPSGLIISQKFQAQLTGIAAAINNSQDAINYMKTADGALGQIGALLQTAVGLSVDASNTGVISPDQALADNTQLQQIAASITNIANTTQFGTKFLLNGTSGVSSAITNGADISSLDIGGTFNGVALATGGAVNLTVTTAATQAITTLTGTFATAGSPVAHAGSFTINGTTFTATAADTASTIVNKINQASAQTGVSAVYSGAATAIVLTSAEYGSASTINVADANGVVLSGTGGSVGPIHGTDAVATLNIAGGAAVTFTGGLNGNDGLTLTDANGNTFRLTSAGNSTAITNATVGQITVGSAQFQIGANAGQTAQFSLGNFAASQLGTGAVAGQNLSTINVLSTGAANTALAVIQNAISQVATDRGQLGAFQQDILQSNVSVLGVAQTNLTATNSQITDVNIASEMTNFTKLQVLEQAGMSVLAQANSQGQAILNLIKNG